MFNELEQTLDSSDVQSQAQSELSCEVFDNEFNFGVSRKHSDVLANQYVYGGSRIEKVLIDFIQGATFLMKSV